MHTIIAGSRTITNQQQMFAALAHACSEGLQVTAVITGGAKGADQLAAWYANRHGLPLTEVWPDWKQHGKRAGLLRNEAMAADYGADAAVVLWDGESRGAADMMQRARAHRLLLWVYLVTAEKLRCIERPASQRRVALREAVGAAAEEG